MYASFFSFLNVSFNILLNDVFLSLLYQALAEAQKGKEQALVDSVSFGYYPLSGGSGGGA